MSSEITQFSNSNLAEVSTKLAAEEDKAKQLAKAKAKNEALIADYEDQIAKGDKGTMELQKQKRQVETDLNKLKNRLQAAEERIKVFLCLTFVLIVFSQLSIFYTYSSCSSLCISLKLRFKPRMMKFHLYKLSLIFQMI